MALFPYAPFIGIGIGLVSVVSPIACIALLVIVVPTLASALSRDYARSEYRATTRYRDGTLAVHLAKRR